MNDLVTSKRDRLLQSVSKILTPRPREVRELPFRQRVLRVNDQVDRLVLAKALADGAASVPQPVVPHALRFSLKTRSWLELLEPELAGATSREPLSRKMLKSLSMNGLLTHLEDEIGRHTK
ncbi:hypothetical protein [Agrobacterium rosae]|uniref:hypothetical protein n=1 Tax=Agrobacterium rosae TaxID=1972867 RepID=UPI002034765B|nr:hypothetical protein [Agrobacterium rosae]MCM2435369.1 hypothetical protein [Agrobacterium rosae]